MYKYIYSFLSVCLMIQIYSSILFGLKVDSTISLINAQTIESLITEKSKIEAYEYGIEVLELDVELVKAIVSKTISENLSFAKVQVGFYFYDSQNQISCSIDNNKCNGVQIIVVIEYLQMSARRIVRYELINKKDYKEKQ